MHACVNDKIAMALLMIENGQYLRNRSQTYATPEVDRPISPLVFTWGYFFGTPKVLISLFGNQGQ